MKLIEITVLPSGESKIETRGFAGDSCREASRFLEAALGKATCETLTAEFHKSHVSEDAHINLNDRSGE